MKQQFYQHGASLNICSSLVTEEIVKKKLNMLLTFLILDPLKEEYGLQ